MPEANQPSPFLQITEIRFRKWSLWRHFIAGESPLFVSALKAAPGMLRQDLYSRNKPPPRLIPSPLRWLALSSWLGFLGLPVSKPWHHVSIVWWSDRDSLSQWNSGPPAVRMRQWLNSHAPRDVSYWTGEYTGAGVFTSGDGVGPSSV